ncbi:HCLS1-associated protein X-1 isoform X2 [Melopsittacus undulatus]|uniref:HCLS1-associated protein X-1 isoform X2 n=1 Tax=Melopsittacus undulatus TaxID=13146 RepID=UPI00146A1E5D|nr:HCLS1-associated protein X-1 isoform X2 [Melopsittacus undulatus]
MSFSDVFRGFFGFPGPRRPRDPLFGSAAWDDDDDGDEDEEGSSVPVPVPPPRSGPLEQLFRDMGELLALFGGTGAGSGLPLPPPEPGPLRDSMLKHPESRSWSPSPALDRSPATPGLKADQDLDSEVSAAGLGPVLRGELRDHRDHHRYFQSVSVTRVTLPDGAVEERRTVQDSHGRRETTVTRHRGDQTFTSTITEDGQSRDHREELLRVDDGQPVPFTGTRTPDDLQPPTMRDPSSVLGSIFRRWFSGW